MGLVDKLDADSRFLGIRIAADDETGGDIGFVKVFKKPSQDARGWCVHRVSSSASFERQVQRLSRAHNKTYRACRCSMHNQLWSTYVRRARTERRSEKVSSDDAAEEERAKKKLKEIFDDDAEVKKRSGLRSKLERLVDIDERQKRHGFSGMTAHERATIDRKLRSLA